ncbi:hypothetical protein SLS56_007900 [Neofusicoccum ribis]|uniref:Uncharacterized protein n=1 Tax=Neofusicoccum ribis TaxID=45134 RepID=A0ABR3SLK2_9PEZI
MDGTTCGFGPPRACVSRDDVAVVEIVDVDADPNSSPCERTLYGTVLEASFQVRDMGGISKGSHALLGSLFALFGKDRTQYDVHMHFERRCFRHVMEEDWDSNTIMLRENPHGVLKLYAHFTPKRTDLETNATNTSQTDTTGNTDPSLRAA